MQAIYMDEDEKSISRRTNPVSVVICTRESGRCVEGEYIDIGRSGRGTIGI